MYLSILFLLKGWSFFFHSCQKKKGSCRKINSVKGIYADKPGYIRERFTAQKTRVQRARTMFSVDQKEIK
jgi:hypothetical protein